MDHARARAVECRRCHSLVREWPWRQGCGAGDGNGYLGRVTNPLSQLVSKEATTAPFEHGRVEELLRLFGKAARTHQLYLPNNPVYKTAHDALRAAFTPLWALT